MRLDALSQIIRAVAQPIVRQSLSAPASKCMHCVHHRADLLHIPLGLVTDQFFQKRFKHGSKIQRERSQRGLKFYNSYSLHAPERTSELYFGTG